MWYSKPSRVFSIWVNGGYLGFRQRADEAYVLDVVDALVQLLSHLREVLDDDAEDQVQAEHIHDEEDAQVVDVAHVEPRLVAWQERRPHDHVSDAARRTRTLGEPRIPARRP